MAHWSDRYIGIPFKDGGRGFDGCDCAGLVLLVLEHECGISATDTAAPYDKHDFHGHSGHGRLAALIENGLREWVVVDAPPRQFDLVRFAVGGNPCHVGVCIGGGMFLHAVEGGSRSHTLSLSSPQWKSRLVEFRRHVQLTGAQS